MTDPATPCPLRHQPGPPEGQPLGQPVPPQRTAETHVQSGYSAAVLSDAGPPQLVAAVVLKADEERCTVFRAGARSVVRYAAPFPRPRADRVSPGHLVALFAAAGKSSVVWRWFDAVVLGASVEGVQLWEPLHGEITARPRDPDVVLPPGSRAYVSAGLPGADWWLAGPVGRSPETASVDVAEVRRFFVHHDLWNEL
jgi:hypothetical protein